VRRRRTVEHWRRDVFASQDPKMTAAVKVLCLYLADHMSRDDHKVSLPRDTIAKALGVHRARVAERLGKAVEARFLSHVAGGCTGRTAIYQAQWPSKSVQQSGNQSTPDEAREVTAPPDALSTRRTVTTYRWTERESAEEVTALLDANTGADLFAGDTDRDVGNDEETEDPEDRAEVTVCEWHGWATCPEDCAHAGRTA
jgi:hypothetical protein